MLHTEQEIVEKWEQFGLLEDLTHEIKIRVAIAIEEMVLMCFMEDDITSIVNVPIVRRIFAQTDKFTVKEIYHYINEFISTPKTYIINVDNIKN